MGEHMHTFGERTGVLKKHDRYAIYQLIGKKVSIPSPSKRAKLPIIGIIEDVGRDIFNNLVEVILRGGRILRYHEPIVIAEDKGSVVFLYGDVGKKEKNDNAIFKELRASQMGENVNDVLRRTEVEGTRELRFIPLDN